MLPDLHPHRVPLQHKSQKGARPSLSAPVYTCDRGSASAKLNRVGTNEGHAFYRLLKISLVSGHDFSRAVKRGLMKAVQAGQPSLHEGHGFSRAVKARADESSAGWAAFFARRARV